MGSVVSIPTALSVALITGGIVYGFLEKRPPPPAWNAPSFVTSTDSSAAEKESGKEKKKGKKKKGGKAEAKEQTAGTTANVVSFPAVVPGAFESAPLTPPEPSTTTTSKPKSKKKKSKKSTSTRSVPVDQQSESSATAPESSVSRPRKSAGDADGAWTRVETKKRVNTSVNGNGNGNGSGKGSGGAGVATSVTTATSSVAEDSPDEGNEKEGKKEENRRTLAEKLLPKARKTGVEDMLQTPDVPPLSRVLRVTPRADEHPAAGFSWGDYEDVDPNSSQASLPRPDVNADGEREGKDGE